MRKRIAVIDKNRCHPQECGNFLCAKLCPVNRTGTDCITPGDHNKARIDEMLCTGCGICPARCPFGAITIINLPTSLTTPPIHRYGENSFELYSLPTPLFGNVVGLVGKNGLGKSTAFKILAGLIKANIGELNKQAEPKELIEYFKGTQMQSFLQQLQTGTISFAYKPQMVELLPKQYQGTARALLIGLDKDNVLSQVEQELNLTDFLDNDISTLSGGELQRVTIAATILKQSTLYLFDEPTSYLDIKQRINIARFIQSLKKPERAIVSVEHDLIILDYMADYINIMYGHEGVFGIVSGIKSTREGINIFLDGFLKEENMRFRDHPVKFIQAKEQQLSQIHELISWSSKTVQAGNFSLHIQPGMLGKGEIIGILGENGIGKTTFVKTIANDSSITDKLHVAYKAQYLQSENTEQVATFLATAIDKYYNQIIRPLEIEPLYEQQLDELSGGQLQRVMIAKCISEDADLYLLDEPSAYLDVDQRLLLAKILKSISAERGYTFLVVDHDLLFIDTIADKLLVFTGQPAKTGEVQGPFSMEEGMNRFLQHLDITLRRDVASHRPRINKKDSVKDREQRTSNKWYYS